MKASHIGTMLLATAGLLACGGGGEDLETRATALGAIEGEAASPAEVSALRAEYASESPEGTAGIASATAGPSEAHGNRASSGASLEGRAKALNYVGPGDASNLRMMVWDVPGDQYSTSVRAAGAVTYDAWSQPMYRYRQDENGALRYQWRANGDGAVSSCEYNLEQCRLGTIALLSSLNSRLRSEMNKGKCSNGTRGTTLYNSYNTQGRNLLALNPAAVRFVAHSAVGLALYTGINWYADAVGPYDPTKISIGAKQYMIWMTGVYLTAFIGQDLRNFGGQGLITLQNTALRAQRAALAGVAAVTAEMARSCQDGYSWWYGVENSNTDGFDIEMGNITP